MFVFLCTTEYRITRLWLFDHQTTWKKKKKKKRKEDRLKKQKIFNLFLFFFIEDVRLMLSRMDSICSNREKFLLNELSSTSKIKSNCLVNRENLAETDRKRKLDQNSTSGSLFERFLRFIEPEQNIVFFSILDLSTLKTRFASVEQTSTQGLSLCPKLDLNKKKKTISSQA